jgi:hypothetical protein
MVSFDPLSTLLLQSRHQPDDPGNPLLLLLVGIVERGAKWVMVIRERNLRFGRGGRSGDKGKVGGVGIL